MKTRVTQKTIYNLFPNATIKVGYCNLQNLFWHNSPQWYTVRREGWAADIYNFGNFAIITGYAPFGKYYADYDVCKKYDDLAQDVRRYGTDEESITKELDRLARELFQELKEGKENA